MSQPNKNNGPRGLGADKRKPQSQASQPVVLHNSRVEYDDGVHTLLPWQMLPVWDIRQWSIHQMFTAVSVNALWHEGKIVAFDDKMSASEEALLASYQTTVDHHNMREQGVEPPHEADSQIFFRSEMKQAILGNVGGQRIVRPDTMPIGCVPMEAKPSYGGAPSFEFHDVSLWDWVETQSQELPNGTVQWAPKKFGRPLEIGFFIRTSKDGYTGWDLRREQLGKFRQVPLPFCWQSAEEDKRIDSSGDLYSPVDQAVRLALHLSSSVRRLSMKEGWEGHIYVGIMDTEMTGTPESAMVPTEEAIANVPEVFTSYAMPYTLPNPLHLLSHRGTERARALLGSGASRTSTLAGACR